MVASIVNAVDPLHPLQGSEVEGADGDARQVLWTCFHPTDEPE